MDNFQKFRAVLFSILVSIVSFFLFMFYKKVDTIGDNVTTLTIYNAVKEVRDKGNETRIDKLEQRTTDLETKVYQK